jgi:EpsI family protein
LLLLAALIPALSVIQARWFATGSYYGHGPLVPLVSAWLIWRERATLRQLPHQRGRLGLLPCLAGTALLILAALAGVSSLQLGAGIMFLLGATMLVFGYGRFSRLWFPVCFLVFMVPLPSVLITGFTFKMKVLAAKLTITCLHLLGIDAVLEGSWIHFDSASILVGDVCSGLRTLIFLVAIAAVFAWMERIPWRKVLICLAAGPIAILANVARILLLAWMHVGGWGDLENPWLHEGAGLATYMVALVMLFTISSVGRSSTPPRTTGQAAKRQTTANSKVATWELGTLLVLTLLSAVAAWGMHGRSHAGLATRVTAAIPSTAGGWTGEDLPLGPNVFEILQTEDALYRVFTHPDQPHPVDFYVIHTGSGRTAAHAPEICFQGDGYEITAQERTALATANAPITINRMVVEHDSGNLLVYYWYRLEGKDTPSWSNHQWLNLLRHIGQPPSEGSTLRISTPIVPQSLESSIGAGSSTPLQTQTPLEAADARLAAFAREALSELLAPIP